MFKRSYQLKFQPVKIQNLEVLIKDLKSPGKLCPGLAFLSSKRFLENKVSVAVRWSNDSRSGLPQFRFIRFLLSSWSSFPWNWQWLGGLFQLCSWLLFHDTGLLLDLFLGGSKELLISSVFAPSDIYNVGPRYSTATSCRPVMVMVSLAHSDQSSVLAAPLSLHHSSISLSDAAAWFFLLLLPQLEVSEGGLQLVGECEYDDTSSVVRGCYPCFLWGYFANQRSLSKHPGHCA